MRSLMMNTNVRSHILSKWSKLFCSKKQVRVSVPKSQPLIWVYHVQPDTKVWADAEDRGSREDMFELLVSHPQRLVGRVSWFNFISTFWSCSLEISARKTIACYLPQSKDLWMMLSLIFFHYQKCLGLTWGHCNAFAKIAIVRRSA